MAANVQPIFIDTPNLTEVTFVNADGTTPKTVFTAATDGSKLFSIACTSDDTSTRYAQVYIHDGTTAYLIGTVPVTTLAGTDGIVPAVNLLDPAYVAGLDRDGELFLPTGYTVRVGPSVAITAAKTMTIVGVGGNY